MGLTTWSLTSGIVGAALFVITFLLDGITRQGYDPTHHTVSALATGTRGWLQTTNFIASGLLITAAAPGVHRAASPWLAAAIAVLGLALIASGIFPMDPMRGYPPAAHPGTPATTSRQHQRHDHAGTLVFASLPVAAVIAALTLDDIPWIVYSTVTAATFVVLAARFAAAWETDDPRTGRLQRLSIVPGWTWLAPLCWHLIP